MPGHRRFADFVASKGLHMVSAVHLERCLLIHGLDFASKGLHMVSAVHPTHSASHQIAAQASKGLHMVSAVHQPPFEHGSRQGGFKGAAHG